uniref:Uncharacterized protein n=1 Tax=Globisporangium ultimum (strain ATCC 200006 / CBS 805.95 / DAOM BR144) TaxID=431595 RepID=K3WV09_GLOUD
MAEKLMETTKSAPSVAPSEDSRKPNLHVDTSNRESVSVEETVVGPLEALKLATGSTIQEPAWAQPFPSPSVVQPDQDDSSVVGGVFSPFGLGFDGGIRHGGIANQEPDHVWGSGASFKDNNHENDPLGTGAGGDVFAQSLPMPASAPSSSLSFASIDAIFSQRNESSEALAGLLGVQLAAAPLSHGTPQAKNSRSSRFAFANQPSGLDVPSSPAPQQSTGMTGVPSSPFGMMEPPNRRIQSPFGYGAAVGLGNNNPSSFPMHHDTSAFPPLGSHHHAPAPSPFGNEFRGNSLQSGGENNSVSAGSGLAFLQQMLPNVNISYGGDYPSHSGSAGNSNGMFPEMGSAGSNAPSSAWNAGSLNSLGFDSGAGRSSSGFYDPALVSHSAAPSSGFFGLGSSLDNDNDRHHLHTSLGGVTYRHPGSIMNNGD